jgi:hypothetical protein
MLQPPGQGHLPGVRVPRSKEIHTLSELSAAAGGSVVPRFREGRPRMREAVIVLEQKQVCPICAGRMKTCKVNVECEGRVFRCASCELWQSEGNALPIRAAAPAAVDVA